MTPRDSRAFWGFEDLALFLGAILPAWLAGLLLVRFLRTLAPVAFSNNAVRALAFQSAIYALLVGALWMVITFRYRRPFWSSMGWVVPERGKWWCILGGPALAIGLSIFGVLLHTPPIPTPVESLISGRGSLLVVAFFAVVLGPVFEELLFRGFLQPLLERALGGPALAIGLSIFGVLLHTPPIPTPVESLISGRGSLLVVAFFAVVLGPVFEELLFRGFLQPLLERALGAWLAILLAATGFALLHGQEYQWAWQQLLVVGLAGAAFGYARYKTGSTAAGALLHGGYNLTFFVGYLIQSR